MKVTLDTDGINFDNPIDFCHPFLYKIYKALMFLEINWLYPIGYMLVIIGYMLIDISSF